MSSLPGCLSAQETQRAQGVLALSPDVMGRRSLRPDCTKSIHFTIVDTNENGRGRECHGGEESRTYLFLPWMGVHGGNTFLEERRTIEVMVRSLESHNRLAGTSIEKCTIIIKEENFAWLKHGKHNSHATKRVTGFGPSIIRAKVLQLGWYMGGLPSAAWVTVGEVRLFVLPYLQ